MWYKLRSEALDEEQAPKTECKNTSVKDVKIADNGDSSMQDNVKSLIPIKVFQGCLVTV